MFDRSFSLRWMLRLEFSASMLTMSINQFLLHQMKYCCELLITIFQQHSQSFSFDEIISICKRKSASVFFLNHAWTIARVPSDPLLIYFLLFNSILHLPYTFVCATSLIWRRTKILNMLDWFIIKIVLTKTQITNLFWPFNIIFSEMAIQSS